MYKVSEKTSYKENLTIHTSCDLNPRVFTAGLSIVVFFISLFLTTGCGYHLRGYNTPPLQIESLSLDTNQINFDSINNKFINTLTNNLLAKNIQVTSTQNNQNNTTNTLEIINAQYSKNIISKGSNNLVTQYKIIFTVDFNYIYNKKLKLSKQNITIQRNFNYTQDQILGLENEQNIIINEIIQEATDKIITQMSIVTK